MTPPHIRRWCRVYVFFFFFLYRRVTSQEDKLIYFKYDLGDPPGSLGCVCVGFTHVQQNINLYGYEAEQNVGNRMIQFLWC